MNKQVCVRGCVCVGVCLFELGGGGRMHTYYSFQDRQFQGNYAHSTEFLPLPNHLHHQSATQHLPITAHHSPSLPNLSFSSHKCCLLLTIQFIHGFVYTQIICKEWPSYLYQYTCICLCITHWIDWPNRGSISWPFLLPNCPFKGLWWQDAIEMTSLSCLCSAWKGFSWIWKPQSTLIAIFGWIWKHPSCGYRSPQPDDYGPVLQSWG